MRPALSFFVPLPLPPSLPLVYIYICIYIYMYLSLSRSKTRGGTKEPWQQICDRILRQCSSPEFSFSADFGGGQRVGRRMGGDWGMSSWNIVVYAHCTGSLQVGCLEIMRMQSETEGSIASAVLESPEWGLHHTFEKQPKKLSEGSFQRNLRNLALVRQGRLRCFGKVLQLFNMHILEGWKRMGGDHLGEGGWKRNGWKLHFVVPLAHAVTYGSRKGGGTYRNWASGNQKRAPARNSTNLQPLLAHNSVLPPGWLWRRTSFLVVPRVRHWFPQWL